MKAPFVAGHSSCIDNWPGVVWLGLGRRAEQELCCSVSRGCSSAVPRGCSGLGRAPRKQLGWVVLPVRPDGLLVWCRGVRVRPALCSAPYWNGAGVLNHELAVGFIYSCICFKGLILGLQHGLMVSGEGLQVSSRASSGLLVISLTDHCVQLL